MTRMLFAAMLTLSTATFLLANDVDTYPPGQKPFHAPKAPQPNGVLAPGVCFGYHATKWMPWGAACAGQGVVKPAEIGKSCTSSAIILFDEPATVGASSQGKVTEPVKPMPPVKR
jgi:hypothetical protein